MNYHPTLRARRFSLEGPRIQLAIGLAATVGIVLRLIFPSETEETAPEASPIEAVVAESEVGFAITAASWETESDIPTPNPAHSEGSLEIESESDWQDQELCSELSLPRWENLDIAVRRDW